MRSVRMVPRDEDHATSSVLARPFIEAGGEDRIERLHDPGAWRQGRHDLARALAAEIGEDEVRTRLDERVRCIDEHPAIPGGQTLQRRLDASPRHSEQHVIEARGFLDRGRVRTTTKLGDFVDECIGTTSVAQDDFMAPGQRLSPECERDFAGADRSKSHAPPPIVQDIDQDDAQPWWVVVVSKCSSPRISTLATGVKDLDDHSDDQLAEADEVNVGEPRDRPPDVAKGETCYFARSCPSALSQFSR